VLRRFAFAFLIFLWLGSGASAQAENPLPATQGQGTRIQIGRSTVALNGPWKFSVGDSPRDAVTGKLQWAEPDFDDSKWETVDLTSIAGAIDPVGGFSAYVPGWTTKGHPGYSGYAWYRIRVRLATQPGESLALAGPADMDDAYEIYGNGAWLGSFGKFSNGPPAVFYTQPMLFPLPQPESGPDGSPTEVLAFRVWMEPFTLANAPDAGGFHTSPLVGNAATVSADYQIRWLELTRAYIIRPMEALLFLLLAVLAFSLILFDRSDSVYGWMGTVFLLSAASNVLSILGAWTQTISIFVNGIFTDMFVILLTYGAWVMVWWVWFRLRKPEWMPKAVLGLTLLYMISNPVSEDLFFTVIPHPFAAAVHVVSLVVRLVTMAVLVWIVVEGIRKQGREGWLVLPAVLLVGIGSFSVELGLLHIRSRWFPFGVQIALGDFTNLLLVLVLALLLMRRLLISLREQRRLALDVKQAQEVQQVILPQAHMIYPGLAIESEYRPAREVGGDFFQIIPHASDGSVLIVAGDVAGKGLQAGMLVALLVGAIRTVASFDVNPEVVLRELNRRLIGRGEVAATCLAMRIAADGSVQLANAGHMPPYLNGESLAIEGSLPLGIVDASDFSTMRFVLKEGDRLVLMSDGIVEATGADGELFGFERIDQLLRSPFSAADVAEAAQRFGQEDDISVISVTRTEALEEALA
jgi:Stage II sporulation protein E (SpoIIE)